MTMRQAYLAVLKYEFHSYLMDFPGTDLPGMRTYWARAKLKAQRYVETHGFLFV